MGRRLSTGLVVVRSFLVLGSFVPGAMNGWLLYYLHANNLHPSYLMLVLEILVTAIFAHSLASVLITHTGRRSPGTVWMAASVCLDVIFCFADVTVISLLSSTGLPSNCAGLTTDPWSAHTRSPPPTPGYYTPFFSDEEDGNEGGLDRFCDMERGFFFCAVLMILGYILVIILSIFRICELNYTRNSEVQYLLEEREELLKLELKVQEQDARPQPRAAAAPNSTSAPGHDEEAAMRSAMPRPTMPSSSSSATIPSSSRMLGVNLAAIPESSAHRHAYASASTSIDDDASLNLDASEIHANMAMISDGSRYNGGHRIDSSQQLPPYSPGNQRTMNGHGSENNDTRLSEYVKGGTRAQDIKDSGNF